MQEGHGSNQQGFSFCMAPVPLEVPSRRRWLFWLYLSAYSQAWFYLHWKDKVINKQVICSFCGKINVNKSDINFVAIDVETALGKRWSICQLGLSIVENGELKQDISFLIQPPNNEYSKWNIKYAWT